MFSKTFGHSQAPNNACRIISCNYNTCWISWHISCNGNNVNVRCLSIRAFWIFQSPQSSLNTAGRGKKICCFFFNELNKHLQANVLLLRAAKSDETAVRKNTYLSRISSNWRSTLLSSGSVWQILFNQHRWCTLLQPDNIWAAATTHISVKQWSSL